MLYKGFRRIRIFATHTKNENLVLERKATPHTLSVLHFLFCLLIVFILPLKSKGQVTCNTTGNWSSGAIWSPASPIAGQTVTVAVGCTLYVDISTVQISNLTVNGTLIINANAGSDLNIAGNIIINNGAVIENNGTIHLNTSGNSFTINGTGTYIHNPFGNLASDESIFFNSNEVFSTTSTLHIKKWQNEILR